MNVLDNHITDLDNRIKDICEIAPTVEQSSIQESLSSYGWILLDSWIAWRTLRFLIKDQDISVETQRKWFQTPSSFTASQIKAVWHFGDNVDTFLNENAGHGLKYLIDNEIEKLRNASAHFSDGGVVNGSDYQKIGNYHQLLSNIFLLYEIISFFISLSVNVFETNDASLKMINKNDKMIFEYVLNKKAINYDFNIIDLRKVSIVRIEFNIQSKNGCLCFDENGCYFLDNSEEHFESFKIFGNKGYYRNTYLFKEALKKLGFFQKT